MRRCAVGHSKKLRRGDSGRSLHAGPVGPLGGMLKPSLVNAVLQHIGISERDFQKVMRGGTRPDSAGFFVCSRAVEGARMCCDLSVCGKVELLWPAPRAGILWACQKQTTPRSARPPFEPSADAYRRATQHCDLLGARQLPPARDQPREYLQAVFERLPKATTSELKSLTPAAWAKARRAAQQPAVWSAPARSSGSVPSLTALHRTVTLIHPQSGNRIM